MGTAEEEAKALAELERVRTENAIKEMQRQEELRKLQEQQNNQNKMVADPQAVGQGWPDNEVRAPQGNLSKVAGALGVGEAGDLALARKLLDADRRPAGAAADQAGVQADGAQARTSGAAGVRVGKPAFER